MSSGHQRRCRGSRTLITAVLLLLSSSTSSEVAAQQHEPKKEEWYTRYSVYPPYCATPDEMARRKIPVLEKDSRYGDAQIAHASVLIRHGARTPWSGDINCWDGYWTAPDTGIWNCDLTTYLSPPSPKRVEEEEQLPDESSSPAMFLFEKHYDALMDPVHNLRNDLNGTCQLGQLLLQGYEQELTNGQYLRAAYLYAEGDDHDDRMRLLQIDDADALPWSDENLWYRVDDDQRTLMSGQVLLRGLLHEEITAYFETNGVYPIVPLHTADRIRDIVDPNEAICPRLVQVRERLERSSEFKAYNESDEAVLLREFQSKVLGVEGKMDAIDCLMTTICTDRTLPPALDDYTGESGDSGNRTRQLADPKYGDNLFQRLYDFQVQAYVLTFTMNDAEYSRLGMGPLWAEIMAGIQGIINGDAQVCCPTRPPAKIALFSGHDTTLMPILATLGPRVFDRKWAAYASMLIIEIYRLDGDKDPQLFATNHAFRLLYNGQVLTHLMDGCAADAELCDAQILIDHTADFATQDVNCTQQFFEPETYDDTISRAKNVLSTPGGIGAMILLIIGSALFGALAMFLFTGGGLPRRKRQGRRRVSVNDHEDGGISMSYEGNGDHSNSSSGEATTGALT